MKKSLGSAVLAALVSSVLVSSSVLAAGSKGKTENRDGKGSAKTQGKQLESQKSEKTVSVKVRETGKEIDGIPSEREQEYRQGLDNISGYAKKKLTTQDLRALLTGSLSKDSISADLAKESQTALAKNESDFENAIDIAKIAAQAAGRENGFTDKEAENVLKFVKAYNDVNSNNAEALRNAALSQLSEKNPSEETIKEKIKQILEACKNRG